MGPLGLDPGAHTATDMMGTVLELAHSMGKVKTAGHAGR